MNTKYLESLEKCKRAVWIFAMLVAIVTVLVGFTQNIDIMMTFFFGVMFIVLAILIAAQVIIIAMKSATDEILEAIQKDTGGK